MTMMEKHESKASPTTIRYMTRTRKLSRIEKMTTLAGGEPQEGTTTMPIPLRRKRMLWQKKQRLDGYSRSSYKE